MSRRGLADLERAITRCRRCPRLVGWCAQVAREKRRAYEQETYWGRPVPGFGDPRARIWIIGLAPGAHGANRTGRVFTGDRSGDFLYAALHRAGLASQPESVGRDDGMRLAGTWISAAVRCAPPGNRPLPLEIEACAQWLDQECAGLPSARTWIALGGIAWEAALELAARQGWVPPRPRPRFGHGAELMLELQGKRVVLLGSYHVSQQNTFTGRLTPAMFDKLIARALELSSAESGSRAGATRSFPRSRVARPRGRDRSP